MFASFESSVKVWSAWLCAQIQPGDNSDVSESDMVSGSLLQKTRGATCPATIRRIYPAAAMMTSLPETTVSIGDLRGCRQQLNGRLQLVHSQPRFHVPATGHQQRQ